SVATPTPPTDIHTRSLHDALPIWKQGRRMTVSAHPQHEHIQRPANRLQLLLAKIQALLRRGRIHFQPHKAGLLGLVSQQMMPDQDRKSTRLNSSHVKISYAVFCLK